MSARRSQSVKKRLPVTLYLKNKKKGNEDLGDGERLPELLKHGEIILIAHFGGSWGGSKNLNDHLSSGKAVPSFN